MTSTRQDPSPAHLEVRPSQIQGRGLFATTILPAKRKLGEVSGTLVKLPQARHKVQSRQRIYLVEVSRRLALDCSRGNFFRFLNHSCRPNCYLRVYRHRVEVYSLAPLAPGTELTVDYGATPHQDGMKCRCGNATCRTVL